MKVVLIALILSLSSSLHGELNSKIKSLKEMKESRVRYLRQSIKKLKNNKLSKQNRKIVKEKIIDAFEGKQIHINWTCTNQCHIYHVITSRGTPLRQILTQRPEISGT